MQVQIFRIAEDGGFILYQRAKTKVKGCAPWPKYFISNDLGAQSYFKEFNTLKEAKATFKKLTTYEALQSHETI